jgi:hypothetical protein
MANDPLSFAPKPMTMSLTDVRLGVPSTTQHNAAAASAEIAASVSRLSGSARMKANKNRR